ncbi:hypothetical protein CWO92_23505 [Heyndrickxia camelliae]|uniref:Uncharacterized protein n=1 Tax=Heyndrickxia camelliae TaxID=1707093 RepID=A0A2N3LDD0_9BACI|nr:hypothetical protein CWO92_23505 [Heyndrickxia camelliae]
MNIEDASTTQKGIVKLNSAINSTDESTAATPKAVKATYDLANSKYTKPSTGISKYDLDSNVQASLNKADNSTVVGVSSINGNILINGVESTVYTHPSTHPATMIVEDATHRFVTDNDKNNWNTLLNSPTWNILALQNNVQIYATSTDLSYCKIGKIVYVRGILKNITSLPINIATLPVGYRPYISNVFICPSSIESNIPTFTRVSVSNTGVISIDGKSGSAPTTSTYFAIFFSFIAEN